VAIVGRFRESFFWAAQFTEATRLCFGHKRYSSLATSGNIEYGCLASATTAVPRLRRLFLSVLAESKPNTQD
jgi:hypothetical protein